MPYASDNKISKTSFDGAIEIDDSQYADCLSALLSGKGFGVRDGSVRIFSGTKRTVYSTTDQSKLSIPANDDTPSGYTDDAPGTPSDTWSGSEWETPSPSETQIKEEARKRIEEVMPSWVVERAQTGGPRIPANVLTYVKAIRAASDVLEQSPATNYRDNTHWPAKPETVVFETPPILTRKDDVWDRCTDAEAEALMSALEKAPAKLKGMWFDNPLISHSHDLFSTLRSSVIEALGGDEASEARADEILAESETLT
ncbi:hypothetical protein [Rosistilla oblonga]|uniref:hypothetical protein n=1 Tax=Rosistilla oblonga TaxID=2527990 RepID=UPI003A9747D1